MYAIMSLKIFPKIVQRDKIINDKPFVPLKQKML